MEEGPRLRLKVLIVGAGLGGFSAAISCALNEHEVVLFERVPELAEVYMRGLDIFKSV